MNLKLVSLNLWNGGRLFTAARDFLAEQNADLYFLQEAYNGHDETFDDRFRTVDLLKQVFPNHYAYFAPVYLDTRKKEGNIDDGQLLLSRWPLLKQKNIHIDLPYGPYDQDGTTDYSSFPATVQKAVIEVERKKITLVNVHGPVNLDGAADDERRQKMKQLILSELTEYSIIGGDFNMQPQTQTIRELGKKLTNVFDQELTTTFNLKRKNLEKFPGYATAAVDMLFITPTMKVLEHACPTIDVSDHLPLVATIEI